jgi:nucleotide-binding universal stress UspA family protein
MLPCKKILSAVDFSDASFEALKVANELALSFSAELLLVHVLPDPCYPPGIIAMPGFDFQACERELSEDAQKKLEDVSASQVPEQIERRLILKEGSAGHEILEIAKSEAVDVIVIATHGMGGLHHYLAGSVAQRVIHHAPCAVLMVRFPMTQK